MNTLFLITARGGSKGIPDKNIKNLAGKPLIYYSIDIARCFVSDEFICVSTDSEEIKHVAEAYHLKVPFVRPAEFASDTAGSYDVIMHALMFYENKGMIFENVVLLQPTSPFRQKGHIAAAFEEYKLGCDMVVSVKKVKANVFATFYTDDENGLIKKLLPSNTNLQRRQDGQTVYELNGAVYIMNVNSLKRSSPAGFTSVRKIVMEEKYSADIDEPLDWQWCEYLIQQKIIELAN